MIADRILKKICWMTEGQAARVLKRAKLVRHKPVLNCSGYLCCIVCVKCDLTIMDDRRLDNPTLVGQYCKGKNR